MSPPPARSSASCGYMGAMDNPKRCGKAASHRLPPEPGVVIIEVCAEHAVLYPGAQPIR